ncbi:MAG: Ig domain-containing protein [Candidatus Solibacter sp.]
MPGQKRIPSLVFRICLAAGCAAALSAQPAITIGPKLGASSVGPYNLPLTATGGVPPYTWSVTSGALPAGLYLRNDLPNPLPAWWPANASAGIVGVATWPQFDPGASFSLTVTDAAGHNSSLDCTLTILPLTTLDTPQLPDSFVNAGYSFTLTPGNSNGSVSWALARDSKPLPAGLSLNATSGEISGTPTTPGVYDLDITATDSNGTTNGKHFTLNVYSVGFATGGALGNVKRGSFFSVSLIAAGGRAPYRFSGSDLPPGLTLTSDGFLSGKVSRSSNPHRFNLTVTDQSGGSYTGKFALNVIGTSAHPLRLSYPNPAQHMALGEPNSYGFSAAGGTQPYTWSINGLLPPGLRLRTVQTSPGTSPIDAEMAGTPSQAGSFTFDVVLTDGRGVTIEQPFTINVGTMTVDDPPSGRLGHPYTFYLRPSGGFPAYRWKNLSPLPAGLVLDSNTGVISGTPLEDGDFRVDVEIEPPPGTGGTKILRSVGITIVSPGGPQISSRVPSRREGAGPSINRVTQPIGVGMDLAMAVTRLAAPAAAGSALHFVPVTPCRIADTRGAAGPYGGPSLAASTPRDFGILGICGIPANAQAYSLNLTVVPLGPLGFLSVWPTGQAQPVVSTLNSGDGRVKANAAIVPAGTGGAITLFASNNTHAIVDINGYFVAADNSNLAFYPITPCRITDTRIGTGTFAGPALAAGAQRSFPVPSSACGVPTNAQAYAMNFTVIPAGTLGFLSAWPTGVAQPGSSTLNAPTGAVTANAAIVPAGTNGAITLIATHNTHVIIDINGYFAPPGAGGMEFYTAVPCRIADTRGATGPFGGPQLAAASAREFVVPASTCNIPAGARAYSLNATVVPPASLGFLSLWGSGGQPSVSTLNAGDGSIVANAALVPASDTGSVTAFASNATHLILDINGYFATTAASSGPIGLPSGVTAGLGGAAPFAVTLPVAAPANGTTVTLVSADPTRVTVTPGTVSISAGQTTPAVQPVVHGINVGSAIISASAPGYTTASRAVTINASVSWPSAPAFNTTGLQNVTLTLSGPAPVTGLTVSLSSSNQVVATVQSTATFTSGSTTVNVPVTVLAAGTTVLHASGLNIPDSAATLTVTLAGSNTLSVTNVTIGKNLQAQIEVSLSSPVSSGPLNVTLTSGDGSKLVIGSLLVAGQTSKILQFPVGSNSGIAYAQALAGTGTVTVTASAPGYTSGSGTVTLTPSAFVIAGPAGVVGVPSFPTNVGIGTVLTVMAGRLDASLNYVETQALRGGLSVAVPVTSSVPAAGQVSPASLTFTPADTAYTTTFNAVGVGTALVTVSEPTGFSTPIGNADRITANVSPGGVVAPNAVVGRGLEVAAQIALTGAPSVDTVLTLISSDPSRLRFGASATDAGVGTIPIPGCVPPAPDPANACKIIKIRAGQTHSADFYIQALASTGSATYTATIPVFGSSTGTVSFAPSGILIAGPFGLGNSFSVASGSGPSTLTVESARLDASRNFVELQAVAAITGVAPVSVTVTSSNTAAGTITASPVTIPAGLAGVTTSFQPAAAGGSGNTTISVDVPAGFTAPAAFGSIGASVGVPGIGTTGTISLGKFLQVQDVFTLGAPAPAGTVVTFTSNNPSLVLLSTSPSVAGSASITIAVPANGFTGTYYVQGFASSGTATITASAPGFATHTGTVVLTPSGVVLGDGINPGNMVFGNTVVVSLAQLDPLTNAFSQVQQLAGGLSPVSVGLSTNVAGATITSPVVINAGTDSVNAVLTGSGAGRVTAVTPPGFTNSNYLTVDIFF